MNEDEIVKALREIADEIDKQKFQGVNMFFNDVMECCWNCHEEVCLQA